MKKRRLASLMTHHYKKLPVTMKMCMQFNVKPRTKEHREQYRDSERKKEHQQEHREQYRDSERKNEHQQEHREYQDSERKKEH